MFKNKKGDMADVFVYIIIAIFLAISFIVVIFVNGKLRDVITETALNETSVAPTIINAMDIMNETTVQRGYALFMGILLVGILVSSFLVRVHPAFIFIYIIGLAFAIFVSVFLGNLYYEFIQVEEFATIAANQGMITFFMKNLVKLTLAIGALSMIIVFSKIFSNSGGDTI